MSEFASLEDVVVLSGKTYTNDEEERIAQLLVLVSDALRFEASRVGMDLDAEVEANSAYASVVRMVTVDVVIRAFRQSYTGEPISQETQSALGYSWTGTYAIPGGGISGAIMRNDLKRLGFRKQRYGSIEAWPTESQG